MATVSVDPDGTVSRIPSWLRPAWRADAAAHRLPGLDGLRAFAIAAVMLSHFFPSYFEGGSLGVDLFFVISGFIITERLLLEYHRAATISLAAFYRRRVRRLWPALWLLVAVVATIGTVLGSAWKPDLTRPGQLLDGVYALTSTMNVVRAWALWDGGHSYLGHTWSWRPRSNSICSGRYVSASGCAAAFARSCLPSCLALSWR